MNVRELISMLEQANDDLPVSVIAKLSDGGVYELPFIRDNLVVTLEGGGAAPAFIAINVEEV